MGCSLSFKWRLGCEQKGQSLALDHSHRPFTHSSGRPHRDQAASERYRDSHLPSDRLLHHPTYITSISTLTFASMLHVQPLLSMQSSLVSGHNPSNGLYQLPQLRDFDGSWNKTQTSRASEPGIRGWPRGYTEQSLIPSPRMQLSNMNGHLPPVASNISHQTTLPLSVSNHNISSHSTPQASRPGHSRQNSRSQPFYQSYYSARQHTSPGLKKDNLVEKEQSGRRKASIDTNSIASYLQIPATINNSKGSLPEFAAQVCLL